MEISPTKSNWTRRISLVALGLAFFASIGCNTSSSLVQFQGTILVDGTPAKGAILLFHPDGGKSTTVSSGEAKEDGTFTLVTDTQPGIPPGNYIVTVTWPDPSHKVSDRDKMTGLAEPGKTFSMVAMSPKIVPASRSKLPLEPLRWLLSN
jgi:hypothetical protein